MFRLFSGYNKKATFRPIKSHKSGSKQEDLHKYTMKTLGSGNLVSAVALPPGEDANEWIASNTVDFFNEVSLIWGIVGEMAFLSLPPGRASQRGLSTSGQME